MSDSLNAAALDQLFRTARTQNAFADKPVSQEVLRELYELVKWGPTAANSCPARFVFVTSAEGKAKLKPALSEGNAAKTLAAPVTVIVAHDEDFHEKLPYLFPHIDAKSWFDGPREGRTESAFRNGSLQGAYLILAARALGLDAGPMSGFDNAKVDAAFFRRHADQVQFPDQSRLRRPSRAVPAFATPELRRSRALRVRRCLHACGVRPGTPRMRAAFKRRSWPFAGRPLDLAYRLDVHGLSVSCSPRPSAPVPPALIQRVSHQMEFQ